MPRLKRGTFTAAAEEDRTKDNFNAWMGHFNLKNVLFKLFEHGLLNLADMKFYGLSIH